MVEFKKYPKIYAIGHEENKEIFADPEDDIVIEEKMDGGNFRFYITQEGQILFGSRTQELDLDSDHTKNFKRCAEFVKEAFDKDPKIFKSGNIFYGECMIKHTMNYDWEKIPPFLGYDVYNLKEEIFLSNHQNIFEMMGLPHVPIIDKKKAKDITEINDDLVPKSAYPFSGSKDQKAEGIVFKNYTKQIFAKYVRDVFKEKNSEMFGGNPKFNKVDETDNEVFMFKYCTNPRIDKTIFKLVDEGAKLDLKLMSDLPRNVYNDIWSEHWQEIRDSNWVLDMKKLRKLVPRRCLAVLKQVMVNNALNGDTEQ